MAETFGSLYVLYFIFLLIFAVLWLILPFAIFGIKPLLSSLLAKLEESNEKQSWINRHLNELVELKNEKYVTNEESEEISTANRDYLDSTELENLIEKKLILSKAKKKKLVLDEETLNFVTKHEIHEIAPYLLEKADEVLHKGRVYQTGTEEELLFKKCKEFFLTLDEDKAKSILHEYITRSHNLFEFIIDIIEQANLLDFLKALELIKSNDFYLQKRGLTLLDLNKSFYTEDDFKIIVNILNIIEKTFPPKAKLIREKSKLSSKVKEKWLCDCGTKNAKNINYCSSCLRDMYGFKKNEVKPREIKEVLTHKALILKEYFNIDTNKGI